MIIKSGSKSAGSEIAITINLACSMKGLVQYSLTVVHSINKLGLILKLLIRVLIMF